jgi:hypothetical protein
VCYFGRAGTYAASGNLRACQTTARNGVSGSSAIRRHGLDHFLLSRAVGASGSTAGFLGAAMKRGEPDVGLVWGYWWPTPARPPPYGLYGGLTTQTP